MTNAHYFDASLAAFISILLAHIKQDDLEAGWIWRDASGHLGYISASKMADETQTQLIQQLQAEMSAYFREGGLLDLTQPGIQSLLNSATIAKHAIKLASAQTISIRLVDRRIIGTDWLNPPALGWQQPAPARFVFASLKGGVGRSTALAVVATHLAREGKKVLAIDLDLEAPGLGEMLLHGVEQPQYGVLDWLVERQVYGHGFDDGDFLRHMFAASAFADHQGLLHVVPAVGSIANQHPENVLAKLARAYLDISDAEGNSISLAGQIQELVNRLSKTATYDVILVDARAGLNESTAAALLGLGGDILLFGIDTPQTFASYRYLLSHLASFSFDDENDWLLRLHMVHAKAGRESFQQKLFHDRAFEIFNEFLYETRNAAQSEETLFPRFGLDSQSAPHYAWPILFDSNFLQFDPLSKASQLDRDYYLATYKHLIDGISALLASDESN